MKTMPKHFPLNIVPLQEIEEGESFILPGMKTKSYEYQGNDVYINATVKSGDNDMCAEVDENNEALMVFNLTQNRVEYLPQEVGVLLVDLEPLEWSLRP